MRFPLGRRLLPATCVLLVALTLAEPAGATGNPDPATSEQGVPAESTDAAAAALDQVQELLAPQAPGLSREQASTEQEGRDLTLALRDLRLRMDDLSAADRAAARRATRRPAANAAQDFGAVRVHWKSTNTAITPQWVKKVGKVVNHVLSTYAAAGYRAPKPDGTGDKVGGGTNLFDVYLVDFDQPGLYGYCDTDVDPAPAGPYDAPAYCAFNHTFSEFPRTPTANLKVTAAHELFHAVQFAYDYNEDAWFMEATAVWAEDEVYDRINDNLQYLDVSPLRQPGQPLDQFGDALRQYGEWFFFRYLSERYPKAQGGMPTIVRKMWERVDGAAGGPDSYSIKAVAQELKSRGTDLRRAYARFADANRRPQRTYEEGASYRRSPARGITFTRENHDTGWQQARVDHLASKTIAVRPTAELRLHRLRVEVDLPRKKRGSAAVLTWYGPKGNAHREMVRLSKDGVGTAKTRFGAKRVSRVDLTMSNASIRSKCWQGQVNGIEYSCRGVPRDDRMEMKYRIRAVR
ncbi:MULTISPECIES: MXAN_6640 family putative metalloprotease [unclassified Nocardioides]|uniref:MXAN_6640 family putative metalloprotease n=1 Tax=unclassified Nocardioides TaxID=2615069 RepID=UPI0036138024